MPWRRLMEIGLGMMRLTPEVFWSMTMPEFLAAYDGWLETQGRRASEAAVPTRAEIDAMMARFPDEPNAAAG